MSLAKILEKYRREARSERDKGTKFEELIQRFFQTDPTYASRLANVWLWNKFPFREDLGGIDTGIDIVAETLDGEFWAIQCKCYEENHVFNQDSVAGFLAASSRKFKNRELRSVGFSLRIWVSTTRRFGLGFERAISNQNPPVTLLDLSYIENAPIDWDKLDEGLHGEKARSKHKKIREHQKKALELAHEYFKEKERGKIIMACGTGKTFTALKIAEDQVRGKKDGGLVLCLVPSIALVGQTLREWTADAEGPINAICVCSDPSVSKKHSRASNDDIAYGRVEDLALPASTDPKDVARQIREFSLQEGPTVVFSTYHSIDVISKAQERLNGTVVGDGVFDLIICDEAHRTTGVTLAGEEESAFVKVHDKDFIRAKRRLYMTATPKLYHETTKKKAEENDAVLCSMDNVEYYGEEIYSLSFGEAVRQNLLSDYKVLILTLSETQIGEALKNELNGKISKEEEIPIEDLRKLVGCINALSKRMLVNKELLSSTDPAPMRRAVAFCRNIDVSRRTSKVFKKTQESYVEHLSEADRNSLVEIETDHIDGSMTASERDRKLCWLRDPELEDRACRILTNVRCLSEGVDVPALDAILFLSPRSSQIEVVQAVGRVMRTAPNKKYGYIILPVVISENANPEDVLSSDGQRFRIVWSVLNALRSHDSNFEATVHKLNLMKRQPNDKIIIGPIPDIPTDPTNPFDSERIQSELNLLFEQLPGEIYVKMVEKIGDRPYWERWARDVGEIAKRHIERIRKLIAIEGEHKKAFEEFCTELRQNINPSINEEEVIEMLAQHIVSRPVFDALFADHTFTESNAISKSMSKMLQTLEEQELDKDHETLKRFYDSVRERVDGIDTAEGKQRIIVELYDKFFKMAFPEVVEKLGIVYTPTEIVDFLIHSVESVLQKEFKRSLAGENVHILDPFTGTGTFVTRLLQSEIIPKEDLLKKYKNEIHANEIVLLAYYIACVNIENTFAEVSGAKTYEGFSGACLTDTFQLGEPGNEDMLFQMFPENSKRVVAQKKTPIRVILGNPPYSVGAKKTTGPKNQHYKFLEERIRETYANVDVTNKNALYDSYVKAFRWASDRIGENGGVIAFVTNGGWLDAVAFGGFRKCLEEEFSKIYVFNLRGNQRTRGELSRREGGKIFGSGSRAPIAMTILVKNKKAEGSKAQIFYRDIGDYLRREEKLKIVSDAHDVDFRDGKEWELLKPNKHNDWINLRKEGFDDLVPLGPEKEKVLEDNAESVFVISSMGVKTNRDAWTQNFSRENLCKNMERSIAFYNSEVRRFQEVLGQNPDAKVEDVIDTNPKKFKWERPQKESHVANGRFYKFSKDDVRISSYRPFQKQNLYLSREVNDCVYKIPSLFPYSNCENLLICLPGKGDTSDFSCFITDVIPDVGLMGGQCFPLYYWVEEQEDLFSKSAWKRHDGISNFVLEQARELYGNRVKKKDIFYYVYGILHSSDYRREFASNLKKVLPRVPLVEAPNDFWTFSKAGKDLANLHLNYETLPLPKDIVVTSKSKEPDYHVSKMYFDNGLRERDHPERICYNDQITIGLIPPEAYKYVIKGKSAIWWCMDRYRIRTDTESGITNDPNLWSKDPKYIMDLLQRVIYLSCETVKIMDSLPKLNFSED